VTDTCPDDGAEWFIGVSNPMIQEAATLGYGLVGTIILICLIVWLVRRVV
jgi:hypothetical protein